MNSALCRDSIISPASSNGAEEGGDNTSEFERLIINDNVSDPVNMVPENVPLKPNTAMTFHSEGKTSSPIPSAAVSSSALMMQIQNLQEQVQQNNAQPYNPSMQLSHMDNGMNNGHNGAGGGGAPTAAPAPITMAMLLDSQNPSSQQHKQGVQHHQGDQYKLTNNFRPAAQGGSPQDGAAITSSGGGILNDPHQGAGAAYANTFVNGTPSPDPPSAGTLQPMNNEMGINSILENLASSKGSVNAVCSKNRTKVFHGKGSFPLNLAVMLESVDSLNFNHIISWLPSGKSFVIHHPDQFLAVVLPKFFRSSKHTKLRSFYRKLNRWGFSILRNPHLTKQGESTMKGVWHHPDFFRSRALECLKIALETGDTSSFLTVANSKMDEPFGEASPPSMVADVTSHVGSGGLGEEVPLTNGDGRLAMGKKRSADSSLSLRNSNTTESSDLPQSVFSGGQPNQKASHHESDFSLGDDSTTQNFEDSYLMSQFAFQPGGSFGNQHMATTPNGASFNLANSFTAGTTPGNMAQAVTNDRSNLARSFTAGTAARNMAPAVSNDRSNLASSFTAGTIAGPLTDAVSSDCFNPANSFTAGMNLADMQVDAAASLMNKRGRQSGGFNNATPSTFHQYQPTTQSGAIPGNDRGRHMVGNNRGRRKAGNNRARNTGVSASWTAGSTFSQQNFNFPSAPLSSSNYSALMQQGQGQHPTFSNNDNVERIEGLSSMNYQNLNMQPQQVNLQEQEKERLAPEDVELASFFEKFAESLQK